jgi:hypothetical protein
MGCMTDGIVALSLPHGHTSSLRHKQRKQEKDANKRRKPKRNKQAAQTKT